MKKRPTSLVTGGAGFLGSHVAEELIKMNHSVFVLDDLSGGFKENIPLSSSFITGSILDEKLLNRIFKNYRFDYVYHLAAYAAEDLSHFIRHFNYENNLLGSVNLINRAIKYKIKHFVFASSIAVYGTNQTPMDEDFAPNPDNPYGIAKLAIELDLKKAHDLFGLTYTIFRPHNVYGERQNYADHDRNVVGIFINNLLMKKPLPIFGDGKQTRAFSYVSDVTPYIAKCINIQRAKNGIFNIGADTPYTILHLAKTLIKIMNVKSKMVFLPKRNEVIHAFSKHTKANRVFNIKSTVDLETGLKRMVAWTRKIGPRKLQKNNYKLELDNWHE